MSRRRILITSTVAVVAFLSGGWFMQQGSRPSESVYQRARLFDDILSHVSDLYVDSIDQKQLYRMAIDGMLAELRDPYSGYLDGRELRNLNELSTGNYAGIGAQIEVRDGAIVVVVPLPETPAERAGVLTGDRIVEVSGKTTVGMTQDAAVRALRGPEGSQVTLKIVRSGATELITCVLALRDQILPPTTNQFMPDPDCDLDYIPNVARKAKVETCMSNSFGFGGQNNTLIVTRAK